MLCVCSHIMMLIIRFTVISIFANVRFYHMKFVILTNVTYILSAGRLSVCLSVRLSVTRADQSKTVEVRIMQLSLQVAL